MDIIFKDRKGKNNTNRKNVNTILHLYERTKIIYPLKQTYNIVIPCNIFQTWHTKILPPRMFDTINLIKKLNPCFNHYLFDDNDCLEFIKQNFDNSVVNAYERLIPGAYKADLWRLCILYKKGGIYLDIKYRPLNNFKFINLAENEHYAFDVDGVSIYNAILVCKPNNSYLLNGINKIVENVKNKYYGNCYLEPTGPKLLSKIIPSNNENIDLKHEYYIENNDLKFISYKNYLILKSYNGHNDEKETYSKTGHYATLWRNRQIYA